MACRPLITMSGHRGVKFGIGCTLGGVLLIPRGPKCIFGVHRLIKRKFKKLRSSHNPQNEVFFRSNFRLEVS